MKNNMPDHSIFYQRYGNGITLLVVYVNDIVINGNDVSSISSLMTFLHTQFHTKYLRQLKYFLSIEVTRSKKGIYLSRRKYILDLLSETGKLGGKACSTPLITNL